MMYPQQPTPPTDRRRRLRPPPPPPPASEDHYLFATHHPSSSSPPEIMYNHLRHRRTASIASKIRRNGLTVLAMATASFVLLAVLLTPDPQVEVNARKRNLSHSSSQATGTAAAVLKPLPPQMKKKVSQPILQHHSEERKAPEREGGAAIVQPAHLQASSRAEIRLVPIRPQHSESIGQPSGGTLPPLPSGAAEPRSAPWEDSQGDNSVIQGSQVVEAEVTQAEDEATQAEGEVKQKQKKVAALKLVEDSDVPGVFQALPPRAAPAPPLAARRQAEKDDADARTKKNDKGKVPILFNPIGEEEEQRTVYLLSRPNIDRPSSNVNSARTSNAAAAKAARATIEGREKRAQILYYDPATLSRDAAKTGSGDPSPSEGTLQAPEVVYDSDGNPMKLEELAATEGVGEIYLEHPPMPPIEHPPPPVHAGKSDNSNAASSSESKTTSRKTTELSSNAAGSAASSFSSAVKSKINPASWEETPQEKDQMIIVSTVATMAILVGALSARRLRSRQFLGGCIENESLEDELAYDTAYTTTGGVGGPNGDLHYVGGGGGGPGSLVGGGSLGSATYDTFASPGGGGHRQPPWKGDLEKFDV